MRKQLDTTGLDFSIWRIDGPASSSIAHRYVVHYLTIPEPAGSNDVTTFEVFTVAQSDHIRHAKDMLHGQKYRAKWFGGGIVFQAYAGDPIKHVLAAIRRSETGEDFITAYNNI